MVSEPMPSSKFRNIAVTWDTVSCKPALLKAIPNSASESRPSSVEHQTCNGWVLTMCGDGREGRGRGVGCITDRMQLSRLGADIFIFISGCHKDPGYKRDENRERVQGKRRGSQGRGEEIGNDNLRVSGPLSR